MEYNVIKCKNYNIHTIKTDKFKNCSIEVMFRNNLEKEKITEINMLVDMITFSSLDYPTRREIAIKLEDLYSSSIRGFTSRIGESIMNSFVIDFLNPKYCEEGYLKDVVNFFFDILLKPNVKDNEFDKRSFNIIKNRLKSDIEALKENATRYAFRRSLATMDENSPSSYYMTGYLEDLEKITPSSLIDTYNYLINNSVCDIYIIGNIDMDEIVSLVKNKFKISGNTTSIKSLYVENSSRKKYQDVEEKGKYEQDSFIMIYNLENLNKRERDYTIHLYNMLLGAGSLTCKLYKYLREENSLCYRVSSMYQKYDNLLLIYSGIDKKDKVKCIELVNKAMKEMENGDFTFEELENAKKSIISTIKINEDSPGGIVNNYLFNELDKLPLFEERSKDFMTVTKDEIVSLSKKIKLNTIYLLSGEDK